MTSLTRGRSEPRRFLRSGGVSVAIAAFRATAIPAICASRISGIGIFISCAAVFEPLRCQGCGNSIASGRSRRTSKPSGAKKLQKWRGVGSRAELICELAHTGPSRAKFASRLEFASQCPPSAAGRAGGGGWREPAADGVALRCTEFRMARMTRGSVMKAIIFIIPPQRGQTRGSTP